MGQTVMQVKQLRGSNSYAGQIVTWVKQLCRSNSYVGQTVMQVKQLCRSNSYVGQTVTSLTDNKRRNWGKGSGYYNILIGGLCIVWPPNIFPMLARIQPP